MLTSDSNFDSKPDNCFQPNHFVPLIPGSYSEQTLFVYKDDFPTLESARKSFSQNTSKRYKILSFLPILCIKLEKGHIWILNVGGGAGEKRGRVLVTVTFFPAEACKISIVC